MHHHPWNEERATNLSILTVSRPGGSSCSSKSKMVCSSTSLSKFGNISCAPSLEHGPVGGLSVRCRLLGAVGTSTRADACIFSSEPQLYGHVERLKHDPRHAQNGIFFRRNPESVVDYVMPDCPSFWLIPTTMPGI